MNEFNSRITAQRTILKVVNRNHWPKEDLLSLSQKNIDRWVFLNQLDFDSRLVELIKLASEKLFFLANKSQEQISEEYTLASNEIRALCLDIEIEILQKQPES